MNSPQAGSRAAQRAKRSLHKKYCDRAWFRGVGIVPVTGGLALRLNIDPAAATSESLPETYYKFPVEIVRIGGYKTRDNAKIALR